MTDVKTEGQFISRTMADSGQDDERNTSNFQDMPEISDQSYLNGRQYLHDIRSSPGHSAWLKEQLANDSVLHKDERSLFHGDNPGESLYACNVNEIYCYRDIRRHGIREESSSSQDSTSADSQSVLADNEIDKLFKEILIESSNSSMSRSLSSSSSEENLDDVELPDDFLLFEDSNTMHSDWDSGLSSNNNSHYDDEWSVASSILETLHAIRIERHRGENEEAPPQYPHRALMYHDCQVCLTRTLLRRRVCCDFHICAECMTTYVSVKVNEAKVQIECPNDRCSVLIHRDEVNERLPKDMKDKFAKFLVNANADPFKKTCPACSEVNSIEPKMLSIKKKKLKEGLKVQCPQCSLYWCFLCQAPFHTEMTCKQFQKGDRMVKKWAKELSAGQSNAQKCPKCKIFIQKVNGCDHMKCTKCNTDFCYRCGDRYISIKLLGNHWSKFSLFGCKYRLMPKRPALRRLIRGANFAARLMAGVVLAGLGLAAGAILVGASVVIVPGYGIFRLRRHLQLKEKRKRDINRPTIERFADRDFSRVIMFPPQGLVRQNALMETENLEAQQVQVMVHRSVSFTQEDSESEQIPQDENYDFYINKYTTESTDMVVAGKGNSDSDQFTVLTDVTEVQNLGGYPTVVAHIVSKMAADKEVSSKAKAPGKNRKEGNLNQSILKRDPSETSLGKDDRRAVCDSDDALCKETFLGDGLRKKSMTSTADIPSCSWENLSGSGRVDSGYEENETSQEVDNSEAKSGSLVCSDDADSTKRGNNGCFGNIFFRRVQSPLVNTDYPIIAKNQVPNLQKKSLSQKAATWEKCRRDQMQSLLKSSPLDPVKDFNKLTLIMQKSPVSSVDVADMFHSEVKSSRTDFSGIIHGENKMSESFIPEKDMFDIISWRASSDDTDETESEHSPDQDKDLSSDQEFRKNPTGTISKSYFPSSESHISQFSEVTYL